MKTDAFKEGIKELERYARETATAYMCAEADWRNCHRSKISDCLFDKHWKILHISNTGTYTKHTPIPPSRRQGSLF